MSKIIEKGQKEYECTCCGCKFVIDSVKDIKYSMATNTFYTNGYFYVNCPQCSLRIKLNNNNQ